MKKKSRKKSMDPFSDVPRTLAWAVRFISTDTAASNYMISHPVSLWEWWPISQRGEAQAQRAEEWETLAKEKTSRMLSNRATRGSECTVEESVFFCYLFIHIQLTSKMLKLLWIIHQEFHYYPKNFDSWPYVNVFVYTKKTACIFKIHEDNTDWRENIGETSR